VTDSGHLGISRPSVRPGDEVWLLHGCSGPMFLKPVDDDTKTYVGSAYVHGVSVKSVDPEGAPIQPQE
jgi:hypothetical protein